MEEQSGFGFLEETMKMERLGHIFMRNIGVV